MFDLTRKFDLNLVRVFIAIFETRSVTQAAERLDLTQPTISHALSRLRELYSDRLFTRGPAGLIPSSLCERLYEQLNVALSTIEATLEAREGFKAADSTRRFRIAVSDIGALFFVPPLLQRFRAEAPRVQVEFVQLSESLPEDLATGTLDLAIGNLPNLQTHSRHAFLFSERYVCLVSADHPAAGKKLTLGEFVQGRHLMVTSPSSGHALIDGALAQKGVRRTVVALVPQFSVLPSLVQDSDLMVTLPERVARLFAVQGRLAVLDLPVDIPAFNVQAHWHARSDNSPAQTWLRSEVTETLSRL
ncbi:MAG: LysR family transcriptional regulator [Proteobacteria bacterium]|nr:LysR family transcriptional regulator [Pseudomonadota bacterium]